MNMTQEILIAIVGVTASVVGVVTGGVIAYISNRSIVNREWRNALRKDEISDRKELFAKFLSEADNITSKVIVEESSISEFNGIIRLSTLIELSSTEDVHKKTKKLISYLIDRNAGVDHKDQYHEIRSDLINAMKVEINALRST